MTPEHYLPSGVHPYDHFVVEATLGFQREQWSDGQYNLIILFAKLLITFLFLLYEITIIFIKCNRIDEES